MKLTATLKLLPTAKQASLLRYTLVTANEACNAISRVAWEQKVFGLTPLHKLTYYETRACFNLSAQIAVRCIGKVIDSYKLNRKVQRTFRPDGAIAYDSRILGYNLENQTVSIAVTDGTKSGRIIVPFVCGDHHLTLLQGQRGESDLLYRDGDFYLYATCDAKEEPQYEPDGYLGVDLGIANIATTSDGAMYSGKALNKIRHRYESLRRKLQKKGTKSANRRLKQRRRKEQRFAKYINHCISKHLVATAQGTGRGIALEDLKGIRDRVTVRKRQRRSLHSWSFFDLQGKIAYKAKRAGVAVALVDPRNTSRTCPSCGLIDKRNRPSQSKFCCIGCGFSDHADKVAAGNIASRAAINPPYVSTTF